MKRTLVHFIRHGQTIYNIERRIQGSVDIELSIEGLNQAKSIPDNDFLESYDIAFHSSLSRSKQTLDIILKKFNNSIKTELSDLIIERSYGCFEGMTENDINSKYPEKYLEWKNNENTKIQNAESIESVVCRIEKFINLINSSKYKNILAVTHSGFLYALYKYVTNTDLGIRPSQVSFPNCCSVYLEIIQENDCKLNLKLKIEDQTYVNSCSPTKMIISAS